MKKISRLIFALPAICLFCFSAVDAQSSGGGYALSQTVIAAGGGTSNDAVNNNYKIEGTSGQAAAGTSAAGGAYSARGGFWAAAPLAPTAGGATIGGRVVDIKGMGLRNVNVTLSGGNLSTTRRARTGSFGYFSFEDVEVGQIYMISVQNAKYGFAQESQVLWLVDNVTDIIFQASWIN